MNVQYKYFWWLDLNCGPLVSELTALPTEPQPLPSTNLLYTVADPNLCYLIIDNKNTRLLCHSMWLQIRSLSIDWSKQVFVFSIFILDCWVYFRLEVLKICHKLMEQSYWLLKVTWQVVLTNQTVLHYSKICLRHLL